MSGQKPSSAEKTFFGHPLQLSTLFHIELWERFSFYGMQGILLIYLYYAANQGGLGMDKALAGGIVGAYGGSVYLSTILGAWLADRIWGCGTYPVYRRYRRDDRPYFIGDCAGFDGIAVGLGVYRAGQRRREIVCRFDGRLFV